MITFKKASRLVFLLSTSFWLMSGTVAAEDKTQPAENETGIDQSVKLVYGLDLEKQQLVVLIRAGTAAERNCQIPAPFKAEDQGILSIETVCTNSPNSQKFKLHAVPAYLKLVFFSLESCQSIPFEFDPVDLSLHPNSTLPSGCYGMAYLKPRSFQ